MSTYTPDNNPTYQDNNITALKDTDPVSATKTFNPLILRLINNTRAAWQNAKRPATITIAAHNSRGKNADFTCTGTNDQAIINNAIDSLPATGGKILLLDGEFNLSRDAGGGSIRILNRNNITIEGMGACTVLNRKFSESSYNFGLITVRGQSDNDITYGNTIKNLRINGNLSTFGGSLNFGIEIMRSAGNTVSGVIIEAEQTAIHLRGKENIVTNCVFRNNDSGVIMMSNVNDANSDNKRNTVSNSTFYGNDGNGIRLEGTQYNNIVGNICFGNNRGIHLGTSSSNNVAANVCRGNRNAGIQLTTSRENAINGNTCEGNAGGGISLSHGSDNNAITGNMCARNTIWVELAFGGNSENAITGNSCAHNVTGIELKDGSNRNLIAVNNLVRNNAPLLVTGGSNNTIDGNKIN